MKIALVGCGAVGSFYGGKLARDGRDVHFLLRSDYDVVRSRGVTIHSPQGDFNARPKCAREPGQIGVADLVIIALKTTANDQFAQVLPPLVGRQTALLNLQNGLGNEEQLAALFKPEQILGGLCFVCLNRVAPGVVRHIDHGRIILGEFGRWPEPRTHDLRSMFQRAGVPCDVTDDLASAHWEKLVWNVPFNGLGVASCAGLEPFTRGGPSSEASVPRAVMLRTRNPEPGTRNSVRVVGRASPRAAVPRTRNTQHGARKSAAPVSPPTSFWPTLAGAKSSAS